jgi:hypothetical protein
MNRLSKKLSAGCLATLGVGLYVSSTRTLPPPLWDLALPISAVLYGLFLITFVFQREFAQSKREEKGRSQLPEQRDNQAAEKEPRHEPVITPHRPAYG